MVAVSHTFITLTLIDCQPQLHCVLVEVRDCVECVPFSAQPFYKGYQQAAVWLLEDLDADSTQGPKLCKVLQKYALYSK